MPANSKFTCECGNDMFYTVQRFTGLGTTMPRGHGADDERANPLTVECRACHAVYVYDIASQGWTRRHENAGTSSRG